MMPQDVNFTLRTSDRVHVFDMFDVSRKRTQRVIDLDLRVTILFLHRIILLY